VFFRLNHARILFELGRNEEGLNEVKTCTSLEPNCLPAWELLSKQKGMMKADLEFARNRVKQIKQSNFEPLSQYEKNLIKTTAN
jgi:hypothetical protein